MEERLEALEDALWHTGETISALKVLGGFEDIIAALESTDAELRCQIDAAEQEVTKAYAAEDRAMEREYWRSVI